jgi:chromate transport protein ChrA
MRKRLTRWWSRAVAAVVLLLLLAAVFVPIGSNQESQDHHLVTKWRSALSLALNTPYSQRFVVTAGAVCAAIVALGWVLARVATSRVRGRSNRG